MYKDNIYMGEMIVMKKRILYFTLMVLIIISMIPAYSFAETANDDIIVTVSGPETVVEGKIHKDDSAKLKADVEVKQDVACSFAYTWYTADSEGNIISDEPIGYDYIVDIPLELSKGTYYYVCSVDVYKTYEDVTDTVISDPHKIVVEAGTQIVILDPNGGYFPEMIDNRSPYEMLIGANNSIEGIYPGDPAKEELYFINWSTEPTGGDTIKDIKSATFEHTTKLYAQYGYRNIAVLYANGGTFGEDVDEHYMAFFEGVIHKSDMPKEPTRNGYIFDGWYSLDSSGKEVELEFEENLDVAFVKMEDMELYAKWKQEAVETAPAPVIEEVAKTEVPKTGDNNMMFLWAGVAVLGMLGITASRIRKEQ